MTKNQAVMALRMVKKNQKQVGALENLIEAAGDQVDKADEEYIVMQQSMRICVQKIEEAVSMLGQYANEKTRS